MPKAQRNTIPGAFINQIQDRATRDAVLDIVKRLADAEALLADIGRVTKPLTSILNAANNRIQRLEDPVDAQDAVTLRYLQQYVANFASSFSGGTAESGGADGGTTSPETPPDNIADHLDVVTTIWNAAPLGPASPEVDLYRFCQSVANALYSLDAGVTCGLLHKPSGANIYTCAGETYSISRICYDSGAIFKILIDADPGGARTPCWAYNAPMSPTLYRDVTASGAC